MTQVVIAEETEGSREWGQGRTRPLLWIFEESLDCCFCCGVFFGILQSLAHEYAKEGRRNGERGGVSLRVLSNATLQDSVEHKSPYLKRTQILLHRILEFRNRQLRKLVLACVRLGGRDGAGTGD